MQIEEDSSFEDEMPSYDEKDEFLAIARSIQNSCKVKLDFTISQLEQNTENKKKSR